MCRANGKVTGCDFAMYGDACINPSEDVFLNAINPTCDPDSYFIADEPPLDYKQEEVCNYAMPIDNFIRGVGGNVDPKEMAKITFHGEECFAAYRNFQFLKRLSEKTGIGLEWGFIHHSFNFRLLENSKEALIILSNRLNRKELEAHLLGFLHGGSD